MGRRIADSSGWEGFTFGTRVARGGFLSQRLRMVGHRAAPANQSKGRLHVAELAGFPDDRDTQPEASFCDDDGTISRTLTGWRRPGRMDGGGLAGWRARFAGRRRPVCLHGGAGWAGDDD